MTHIRHILPPPPRRRPGRLGVIPRLPSPDRRLTLRSASAASSRSSAVFCLRSFSAVWRRFRSSTRCNGEMRGGLEVWCRHVPRSKEDPGSGIRYLDGSGLAFCRRIQWIPDLIHTVFAGSCGSWILLRKIAAGSWDPESCCEKIRWLGWVFDHWIYVFDGRCGSLELPVFSVVWKDAGDTGSNIQNFDGCWILHWHFLGSCGS